MHVGVILKLDANKLISLSRYKEFLTSKFQLKYIGHCTVW